jgi:protein TonB
MTGHVFGSMEVVMGTGMVDQRPLGAAGRMGVVVAMHAALLFVLVRGMGVRIPVIEGPDDIQARLIDRPTIDPVQTPIIPPRNDVAIWIPEPEHPPVEQDPPDKEKIITDTQPPGDGKRGSGSAIPQPQITGVQVDARHPLTQPPYPASRIRFNDEGAVDLELYVLPNGRVGDARVLKSSGFEDFDRSALQEARRNWRLQPATRDGEAFAQWYRLRVVFKLQNAR